MQHTVKVIPVIYQTLETRGTGKDNTSPGRMITKVHDLNGNLLAESDPNSYTIEQIYAIALKECGAECAQSIIVGLKTHKGI